MIYCPSFDVYDAVETKNDPPSFSSPEKSLINYGSYTQCFYAHFSFYFSPSIHPSISFTIPTFRAFPVQSFAFACWDFHTYISTILSCEQQPKAFKNIYIYIHFLSLCSFFFSALLANMHSFTSISALFTFFFIIVANINVAAAQDKPKDGNAIKCDAQKYVIYLL